MARHLCLFTKFENFSAAVTRVSPPRLAANGAGARLAGNPVAWPFGGSILRVAVIAERCPAIIEPKFFSPAGGVGDPQNTRLPVIKCVFDHVQPECSRVLLCEVELRAGQADSHVIPGTAGRLDLDVPQNLARAIP